MENNFDIDEVNAKATLFDVVDMDGGRIVAAEEYAENEYTALLQFGPSYWEGVETLKELYNKYKDQGFDIIGYASLGLDLFSAGEVRDFVEQNEFPWRNVLWDEDNLIHEIDPMWSLRNYYPYYSLPFVTVVDSSGDIAFYSDNLDKENQGLEIFLDEKLGGVAPPQYYTSTDYSADGRVSKLQSATEGDGIDVVMMGDAFSDRMIANGTYERVMRDAMEYLFVEEPYKSHRAMFNVYMVDVVSPNEGYEYGMKTALDTWFGDMTLVGGDDYDVTDYTRMALSEERMDEAMTIVMMNSTEYSGTCYLYYPSREGDYGSGYSISYFPMGSDKQVFRELLNHEANGHGFSKLADEYFYEGYGAMPESEKTGFREVSEKFGWNKNVDLTGDPTQVKWAKFISDSRYAGQGLGTFEGAATYFRGAWRPTDNSIMHDNTGGFNAPSRESIYYKMHKMAYGLGWHYFYEEFVAWDLSHRTRAAEGVSATRGVGVLRPSTPPVVRPYTWRELKPAGR